MKEQKARCFNVWNEGMRECIKKNCPSQFIETQCVYHELNALPGLIDKIKDEENTLALKRQEMERRLQELKRADS